MEGNLSNAQAAPKTAEKTEIVRDKVFNTTELLESILLHLVGDFKTLLFSQRVSTVFHNTIEHSTSLQKGLFSVKSPSTDPPIPRILRNREIKYDRGGATLRLSYEVQRCGAGMQSAGIDLRIAYKDMTPDMSARVDKYDRHRRVEISLDMKDIPAEEQHEVEVCGSWQKMSLNIPMSASFASEITCGYGKWARNAFGVQVSEGDTLGSIVHKALRKEKH